LFKLLWAFAEIFEILEARTQRINFGMITSYLYSILHTFTDHAISQGEVAYIYGIDVGRAFQMFPDLYYCDEE
jgi:hypothetical protein